MAFKNFDTDEELMQYCQSTGRAYVSFTLAQSDKELGTCVIELFTDLCPQTCANFIKHAHKGYQVSVAARCGGQPMFTCHRRLRMSH